MADYLDDGLSVPVVVQGGFISKLHFDGIKVNQGVLGLERIVYLALDCVVGVDDSFDFWIFIRLEMFFCLLEGFYFKSGEGEEEILGGQNELYKCGFTGKSSIGGYY